jgi:hypothetical protein
MTGFMWRTELKGPQTIPRESKSKFSSLSKYTYVYPSCIHLHGLLINGCWFLAASTECSAGSNDHFVGGGGGGGGGFFRV